MSGLQNNPNNAALNTSRPQHQLQDSSQPLPGSGSRDAVQTQDYSPANIERMSSSVIHGKNTSTESDDADSTRATMGIPSAGRTGPDSCESESESARSNTASTNERPLGAQPTPEGGVSIGGQPNLSEGHAGFGDKVIGKTQKVIGKYTKNEELHEKGELRETGGKAAVLENTRAAHD
ncbi:uncharacterized protein HD556DRAFT_1431181 [Suillus plorans]|uniref:Uncharacterized protein n=1 Tax=Suillus plorans TaxID=116603 RepID=A0A9P7IY25_9AGAM|nr:uncharacterized protein HD556DRAFT_1431181 [Suillus plorans]KAG1796983.1 hypothetical protein HD556DRAFT_1431181 [Suillus plorans]